ncbi:insecticidal delta-endotoxin Cry8Ea1 family protein, partial [Bacillus mycoides]|uniref:insecticidal delta-endotoxin Cry8Ea1 family protein n=1 Tax=Bacillus mycoides TaxID=1405 RepID=UPI003D6505AF
MNQYDNKNEYEIIYSDGMYGQPRYPLAKAPGSELQQMNYKNWLSRCQNENIGFTPEEEAVKTALIISTGLAWAILAVIPGINVGVTVGAGAAAAAGVLNVLIPFLFPDQTVDNQPAPPQYTQKELMKSVEALTRKEIQESKRVDALARWEGIQTMGRDYYAALCALSKDPDNEETKFRVRQEFNDVEDELKRSMPHFRAEGFEIQMLAMYAQAANLHLTILRDVVRYGKGWGFSQERIDEYYDNQGSARNPGLLQLLSVYTNHCVNWYNKGLVEEYRTGNWNRFNDFRRNMTIMVLDIVAAWPTYDPRLYPLPTESELTRTVYTELLGNTGGTGLTTEGSQPIGIIEENVTVRPQLFRWLRSLNMGAIDGVQTTVLKGGQQKFETTGSSTIIDKGWKGDIEIGMKFEEHNSLYWPISPVATKFFNEAVTGFAFGLPDQERYRYLSFFMDAVYFPPRGSFFSGLPCRQEGNIDCEDPCSPNCVKETLPGSQGICIDPNFYYSHRLSNVGFGMLTANDPQFVTPGTKFAAYFSYGWTHASAKSGNVIALEKITQIPAVKGYDFRQGARVIKGPGSTGGDLVELGVNGGVFVKVVAHGSETVSGYTIRLRYAGKTEIPLFFKITQPDSGDMWEIFNLPATTSDDNLNYTAFNYYTIRLRLEAALVTPKESIIFLQNFSAENNIIIDKIEFIPIEGSLEVYQSNQDLEKARKAVNALFTNDEKNALQLNVTDYAVDQAANLVECVSDEFHGQEKMILLDQVRFAKRLSQTRNLLNHGDFESPDWSKENGWRTSHHVSVRSDNPIFKGRYLHMPGAISTQLSSHVYPTYVYQKVDESKLKSYTRYLVRGFVGNSKDLELLVERYGKDVHVEMDVPNDIQYTLPMNECGGFDRCKPASYETKPSHTCTCNDTAVAHTDCQCKDKGNRTSTNMYTNVPTGSAVYRNGSHDHKSCGCKNNDMYQSGTHPHKSCGCQDPHVFTYHIDTGCVDQEENLGLFFALKIASENGVTNIDNLEIIEAQPLAGEALARVKKREQKWKQEMAKKRLETERAVQAAQTVLQPLFTNGQYNRLKFETLFPQIARAEKLVQQIPYVHHRFLSGALPTVPGMNFEIVQQLSALIENAHALYEGRNLVRNGTFSSGTGNWHVTEGVKVQPLQNTPVLVLSEWNQEASQQLHIDSDRGYVLRVTARKEGGGKGTVTM